MTCIENLIINSNTIKLDEKLYSKDVAIGYHRTTAREFIALIKESGFKAGSRGGTYYGEGLYSTYDIQSQLPLKMETQYGPYIIKYKIPIENYLIFDKEEAVKILGSSEADFFTQIKKFLGKDNSEIKKQSKFLFKKLTSSQQKSLLIFMDSYEKVYLISIMRYIELIKNVPTVAQDDTAEEVWLQVEDYIKETYIPNLQFKYSNPAVDFEILDRGNSFPEDEDLIIFFIPESKLYSIDNSIKNEIEKAENKTFTSGIAQAVVSYYEDGFLPELNGMIFVGRNDGKVIVSYNYNECIPLAIYEVRHAGEIILLKNYDVELFNIVTTTVAQIVNKLKDYFLEDYLETAIYKFLSKSKTIKSIDDLNNNADLKISTAVNNLLYDLIYFMATASAKEYSNLSTNEKSLLILYLQVLTYVYGVTSSFTLEEGDITNFIIRVSKTEQPIKDLLSQTDFNEATDIKIYEKDELVQLDITPKDFLSFFVQRAKEEKTKKLKNKTEDR